MQPYNDQQQYQIPTPSDSPFPATYSGNQKDMTAFLAMLAGAMLIATSCVPGAACVLPIFAFVAGIIGLRGADQAINPSRTRTFSWIAIVTGALVLIFFIGLILLYGGLIIAAIRDAQ
jgi:thiol:disulfide interchange protein